MSKREKGVQIYRPIIYGNTAVLLTDEEKRHHALDHTHKWTVAVRSAASPPLKPGEERDARMQIGGQDDISHFIKRVTFRLHDTYSSPNRNVDKPPFEVTETGWGEFDIQIRIHFVPESQEKPITVMHHLKLHAWNWENLVIKPLPITPPSIPRALEVPPPTEGEQSIIKPAVQSKMETVEPSTTAPPEQDPPVVYPPPISTPVHSWQYDEVVFVDPTTNFYNTLLAHPPTPIPRRARHPWRKADPPLGQGGNIGELSLETEDEEADRLDEARSEMRIEIERLRDKLQSVEKELEAHGWGSMK